jgi:hypothetical protein
METADFDRREDQTRFQLVLRDDRLGRVSLNLTERAGLIDLMVRADRPATARTLQDSLPALVDSLAQRNLRAEPMPFAPDAGLADPRESPHVRGRRERRAQEPKTRLRSRRVAGAFAASQE